VPQIAPRSQGTQLAEYDREIDEQLQSLHVHDGEGKEAWLRPQRAEIRSAHAIVQDVRGLILRASTASTSPPRSGRTLRELAGAMPRHQDYRRQSDERQDQARVINRASPSLEIGRSSIALRSSKSALGAYFRRMCGRHG